MAEQASRYVGGSPSIIPPASIICRGEVCEVRKIRRHAPGKHPQSPIRNELYAAEYTTDLGSRWFGVEPV